MQCNHSGRILHYKAMRSVGLKFEPQRTTMSIFIMFIQQIVWHVDDKTVHTASILKRFSKMLYYTLKVEKIE